MYPIATEVVSCTPKEWSYWSARDPEQLRTIEFPDLSNSWSGEIFTLRSGNNCLIWRWGCTTAVGTDLRLLGGTHSHINGAFFTSVGRDPCTLYMLPLAGERAAAGLPPPALPTDVRYTAPRVLHRGPDYAQFLQPRGSHTAAPLVRFREREFWQIV